MINKLISKSQVRLLEYEGCPSKEYSRGYVQAINDVLDLEPIPTLGVDTVEKIRAEIKELTKAHCIQVMDREDIPLLTLDIIDKHIKGE